MSPPHTAIDPNPAGTIESTKSSTGGARFFSLPVSSFRSVCLRPLPGLRAACTPPTAIYTWWHADRAGGCSFPSPSDLAEVLVLRHAGMLDRFLLHDATHVNKPVEQSGDTRSSAQGDEPSCAWSAPSRPTHLPLERLVAHHAAEGAPHQIHVLPPLHKHEEEQHPTVERLGWVGRGWSREQRGSRSRAWRKAESAHRFGLCGEGEGGLLLAAVAARELRHVRTGRGVGRGRLGKGVVVHA